MGLDLEVEDVTDEWSLQKEHNIEAETAAAVESIKKITKEPLEPLQGAGAHHLQAASSLGNTGALRQNIHILGPAKGGNAQVCFTCNPWRAPCCVHQKTLQVARKVIFAAMFLVFKIPWCFFGMARSQATLVQILHYPIHAANFFTTSG